MSESPRPARRPLIHLSPRRARALRVTARLIALAAWLLLLASEMVGLVPFDPEGHLMTDRAGQLRDIMTATVGVGLGASLAWPPVGAGLLGLAGLGLGLQASLAYPVYTAMLTVAAFLVPAIMLWLGWKRDESVRQTEELVAIAGVLVIAAAFGGSYFHARAFGPQARESTTVALEGTAIRWAWAGAVTDTSFAVVVKPLHAVESVGLSVSDGQGPGMVVDSAELADGVARLEATGLAPDTEYEYRFVLDGSLDHVWVGHAGTHPAPDTPGATVTVGFASCARTGSNAAVFDEIRRLDPDLFVFTGDLHYNNIGVDSVSLYQQSYDQQLTQPAPAAMLREVPAAYVWDDHDYGANDADHSSPSKPAVHAVYRQYVPHGPLPLADTISQVIDVGPVRLLLTDLRSMRDYDQQTMMGLAQLDWMADQLRRGSDDVPLMIFVSPSPWIGAGKVGQDHWGGFVAERRWLSDVIRAEQVDNLMIVTGDAHMLAIDDGTNSDYASPWAPPPAAMIPLLNAAALDREGSVKGGPYSGGTFPGPGQFGLVTVTTRDGQVDVLVEGRNEDGEVVTSLEFTRPMP